MASPGSFKIDPEVEDILLRIAGDPASALLRVPRPASVRSLYSREAVVKSSASLLTMAERHLVQAHRSEIARLLVEICRMKLIDGPHGRLHVSPFQTTLREHVRWSPAEMARQVERVRLDITSVPELGPAWLLLSKCVGEPFGATPTVSQLAEASLRLEPTDDARLMAGLDLSQRGAPEATIRILKNVLVAPASESVAACTQNNLGVAYSFLGDMHTALDHHIAACRFGEDRLEPWMNRLVLAIQLGLVEDALIAAENVDMLAPSAVPAVEVYAKAKERQRIEGGWYPSPSSYQAIRSLESRLGIATRRIIASFGPVPGVDPLFADFIRAPQFGAGTGILPKNLAMRKLRLVS